MSFFSINVSMAYLSDFAFVHIRFRNTRRDIFQDFDCPGSDLILLHCPFSFILQIHDFSLCTFHLPYKMSTLYPDLGVAVEDDIYKEARQQIEQELAHREAVATAARILKEILDGVRTPERPSSPVDAYITVIFLLFGCEDKWGLNSCSPCWLVFASGASISTRNINLSLMFLDPRGPFLESPESFSGPKSHS